MDVERALREIQYKRDLVRFRKAERIKTKRQEDYTCLVCKTLMTLKSGFGGTQMCGPCATGDSSLLEEFGSSW